MDEKNGYKFISFKRHCDILEEANFGKPPKYYSPEEIKELEKDSGYVDYWLYFCFI